MSAYFTGQAAEDLACDYLKQHGLQERERNYRCKMGEIDLIMDDQKTLVFVEVRHRKQSRYGSGAESVTPRKQARIIKAATYYLIENHLYDKVYCRFDVIATAPMSSGQEILWIKDAFQRKKIF